MADESGETRRQRNARFGIAESPELEAPDAAAHVWGWFWELSGRSHSGPEALTFADIGQWASLLQLELLTDSSPIQPPPAIARSAADPRAAATGPAPGSGWGGGDRADQGGAGAAQAAGRDEAQSEGSDEDVDEGGAAAGASLSRILTGVGGSTESA